jgi:hypothetical protein
MKMSGDTPGAPDAYIIRQVLIEREHPPARGNVERRVEGGDLTLGVYPGVRPARSPERLRARIDGVNGAGDFGLYRSPDALGCPAVEVRAEISNLEEDTRAAFSFAAHEMM